MITTLTGMSCSRQVASSWMFIWNEPSPVSSTLGIVGSLPTAAPMAAGRPKPIVPRPPELIQRRGLEKWKYCAAHIWCWPTSEARMQSPPRRLVERLDEVLRLDLVVRRVVVAQRVLGLPRSSRSHQPASRAGSGPTARYSLISRARTFLASPTIGMWAGTFLEISAGSMSMCTNFARGANSASLPVMRSSKRAPTATIRSASSIA